MESKLLSGGGIMDRQSEQKKALENQRQAMIEQKVCSTNMSVKLILLASYYHLCVYWLLLNTDLL